MEHDYVKIAVVVMSLVIPLEKMNHEYNQTVDRTVYLTVYQTVDLTGNLTVDQAIMFLYPSVY